MKKVYVEITDVCNLDCSFCNKTVRKKSFMTKDNFITIADKMKEHASVMFFHLMGEPTLHPDLPCFIEYANSLGYKTILTTNGTTLNKTGDAVNAAKPYRVNLSLHSYEATQNNPHPNLESYIISCLEFAKKCRANSVFCVLRLWNKGGLNSQNEKILSLAEEFFPKPWEETKKGYRITDRVFIEWDDCFIWPNLKNSVHNESCYCLGVRDQIGILVDGTVVPCCLDSDGIVDLGNIFEKDFKEIYSSPRTTAMLKGFQKRKAVEELCLHCGYCKRF